MLKIHNTNNPAIIKLEFDDFLVQGNYEFQNIDQAKNSPLAQELFYLPFIKTVYISGNFIALERYSIVQWSDVQQEVAEQIQAYISSGKPVVIDNQEDTKKQPITIYAESTPNPSVMKFVCNKRLVDSIYEFQNIDQAKNSPLAMALFHFPYVKEVFLDRNYISVMKYDIAIWEEILMELREFIRDYISSGKEILIKKEEKVENYSNLDDISQKIIKILEEYVRPAVSADGGNIQFLEYDNQTQQVKVILQGACSGCPSSKITLKNGIENMLREMLQIPTLSVEAFNK